MLKGTNKQTKSLFKDGGTNMKCKEVKMKKDKELKLF